MSPGEADLIKHMAETLGISEPEATEEFQRRKERFLLTYERLKRRFPNIAALEQKEAKHIKERAARRHITEREAAASLMMEKMELERFRRKKLKITPTKLRE